MSSAPVGAGEPFIGRAHQLCQFSAARDVVARGRGSMVVVSGEAGIGKTRFCTEVAERARELGARAVMARCWLDGGAPPLWPWQSILAELGGDRAADLLTSDADVSEVGPDRFARFTAVTDRLAEACARTPVCLVIDDVHGADAGALLLTRFVARSLSRLPLLLVLSRRNDEPAAGSAEARMLDELERDGTSILLGSFDLAETTAFLAQHGLGPLDDELVTTLFGVTGGHPLFLRRIIQTIGDPGAEPMLPAGLQVAIEHALLRLTPPARRVLSVATVLGSTPLVTETAEVAGCDTAAVLDAVEKGADVGLVAWTGDGRFSFSHDLVRSTIEDTLGIAESLETHARAASVVAADHLAGPEAHRLARAAHHARRAAARSRDDARRAVSICESAAQAMVRNFDYEQADALFSAAMELHTSARLGHPPALLALQWAQAASLRGYMGEAQARYGVAAARAEAEHKPALLGEAALGRGGAWLDEHFTPVEGARALDRYRRSLELLPPDDPDFEPLRCRLTVRLAAEAVFNGGPTEPLRAAVDAARRSGDDRALAEALSLSQHALFTPVHCRTRLEQADELVHLTSETDQGVLSLMGLLWRTIDLIHLGDEQAFRALEVLRERATALGNQHILYNVAVIDVLYLINSGRLADAEAEARRCHELGEQTGRVDRLAYLTAQLASIRWAQGRDAEVLDDVDDVAKSPTLSDREFSFWTLAACLAARSGDTVRARSALDRFLPDKLADLAQSGTWMAGLVALVDAAAILDDQDLAGQAYELLLPYADLPSIAGLGIVCLGSTERPLGLAASTLGHHDLAVEHLERAVAANQRFRNHLMATITRAELALALLQRDSAVTHDRDRAVILLDRAIADGTAMGLTGRVAAWEDRRRSLGPRSDASAPTTPAAGPRPDPGPRPARRGVIRREGRRWVVALGDRRARVGDLVGMTYLADLLTHPGQRIPAVTLIGQVTDPAAARHHELLDDEARNAYAARARELTQDLQEAETANDLHRAERLRMEYDALIDQLEATTGLSGHARHFPDDHERARTAVRKAIKRAIDAIEDAEPAVAVVFHYTVSTGATCIYTPDSHDPVTWSTSEL